MVIRPIIIALLILPLPASVQTDPRALAVHVRSEKTTFRLSESIKLEIRVQNITDEPVTVFGEIRWGFVGGTQIHVRTTSGQEVRPFFLDHDMLLPGEGDDPAKYVSLAPGHFLGVFRTQPLNELIPEPGMYRIIIEYSPPLGARKGGRPGITSPWSVFSRAVMVEVLP